MVSTLDNTVVQLKSAKRVEFKWSHPPPKKYEVMDMLINQMGESFHSVYVYQITSVHFQYLTVLYINYKHFKKELSQTFWSLLYSLGT